MAMNWVMGMMIGRFVWWNTHELLTTRPRGIRFEIGFSKLARANLDLVAMLKLWPSIVWSGRVKNRVRFRFIRFVNSLSPRH
jgi:hypothetical protein